MPAVASLRKLGIAVAALGSLFSAGCASAAVATPTALPVAESPTADGSVLCQALSEHFVGLPAGLDGDFGSATPASAGRWWVRSCSAKRVGSHLHVELSGPGWYWVDDHDGAVSLKQQ